jgi:hypothetical protein
MHDRAMEQRMRYGNGTFWSLVSVVGCVLVLSCVVSYFFWKERRVDLAERQKWKINFSVF